MFESEAVSSWTFNEAINASLPHREIVDCLLSRDIRSRFGSCAERRRERERERGGTRNEGMFRDGKFRAFSRYLTIFSTHAGIRSGSTCCGTPARCTSADFRAARRPCAQHPSSRGTECWSTRTSRGNTRAPIARTPVKQSRSWTGRRDTR